MNKATIFIDGSPYDVRADQSLLRACLSLGFDVPYFCWHPALESVGACRQCAVKVFRDEKDTKGKIVMSCMTPVSEGLRVSPDDPDAKEFRARNIEWLMLNHPHDCPVCDEGGECHLQDMTVMTGHTYRRTRFAKRTYNNQDLGPFINHEMNRCIHCYRCVRFYRDYAHGRDFDALASHDSVYFGRHESGTLENVFSGNLVEICPTGVFTDKTEKRRFTRKWDLQTAPSVCVHCSLGCNTIPAERYGELRRIRNRYNSRVNGYFLCDRGRYGYGFVNSSQRVRQPFIRDSLGNSHRPASREQALAYLQETLANSKGLIGIGSGRASLEANYALRTLVGSNRFFSGMTQRESDLVSKVLDVMKSTPAKIVSLAEAHSCDAVFILGEDVVNTAPLLALAALRALRNRPMAIAEKLGIPPWDDRAVQEAVQHEKGPLFIAASQDTWLDPAAEGVYLAAPNDLARLGFAVAHHIDTRAPDVPGLEKEAAAQAVAIAEALKLSKHPLIITGTSCGSEQVIEAGANVALALCETGRDPGICLIVPECNSLGLSLMSTQGIDEAFSAIENGEADTLIVLENDLFRRDGTEKINTCLEKCASIVLIDHVLHATASKADIILPAASFAEQSGTLVNNEGRGQRFFQVFVPEGEVHPAWQWIEGCMAAIGSPEASLWEDLDDIMAGLARDLPVFKSVPDIAPSAKFRMVGQKIPRQSHRASGRTSMHANLDIHEPALVDDPDSPLAFSMEGFCGEPPAALISRYWAPGWNSVQALNKFQAEVGGQLHGGEPGIRLVEPDSSKGADYFKHIPDPFTPDSSFLLIPLYHIFGSEELSVLSPAVAGRAPKPYVALNPADAARLGLGEGEEVEVTCAGASSRMPVVFRHKLPVGTAGLPAGLPDLEGIIWNEHVEIRKVLR
jgi:NADH-quinone oxidoreductase subunit G